MKKLLLSTSFLLVSFFTSAQNASDFLIGTHMDLIKSDNDGYFEKAQLGVELNYFLSEKFTATGGMEIWTRDGFSAVLGTRWYPNRDAFVRIRGMLGKVDDLCIGGGWAKPLSETLRFESMADLYFEGHFTIRAGFAIIIE